MPDPQLVPGQALAHEIELGMPLPTAEGHRSLLAAHPGATGAVLTTIGLIGIAGVVIGVMFTLPYASFVGAYLVGWYAQLTDRPVLRGAEAINR